MTETPQRELVRLSHEWMTAWQQRDEVRLNELLADGFTLASSLSSDLMSREQWLDYALHYYECKAFSFDRTVVRLYEKTGIVTSWYRQQASVKGQDRSGRFLLTDVWIQSADGQWQVVARHSTQLDR